MTIGTAIVVSIGILCGTFIIACLIGAHINNKKIDKAQNVLSTLKELRK